MADLNYQSFDGTSTASTYFQNSQIISPPVHRRRRLIMKETIIPTALVSPQTKSVKVQPAMVPYNLRHRTSTPTVQNVPYSNELESDLSCTQTSSFAQLPEANTKTLQGDHSMLSPSSMNISCFSNANCSHSESDNRLELLENRMRFLESRLRNSELISDRNLHIPQSSCTSQMDCTCIAEHSSSNKCFSLNQNYLEDKIRKLQIEVDNERCLRDKQMAENCEQLSLKESENKTLLYRVQELESENRVWQERFHSSLSHPKTVEDLKQEKVVMQKTIDELIAICEQYEKLSNKKKIDVCPEDRVSIEKYLSLKANCKKMLIEKNRILRTEILEKETIKVQMQLQNAELSELRKVVNNLKRDTANIHEGILKSAQSSQFNVSCLLGVIKDITSKKTPDYDQILGLKSATGVSISDQKWDQNVLEDVQVYNRHLFNWLQNLNTDIVQMQRLMVDYYTNEVVDAVDCRLQ